MESKPYKFLFLCTGNSARSSLGEYLLRGLGGSRFQVYSAGSFPTGKVNPLAIQVLKDVYNIDASEARSKSWEEFKDVEFDFVVTVCDNSRETCPVWPGHPATAHWGIPDPAALHASHAEIGAAFADAYHMLTNRVSVFVALPFESLDHLSLREELHKIGQMARKPASSAAAE